MRMMCMDADAVGKDVFDALRDFGAKGTVLWADEALVFLAARPEFYQSAIAVAKALNSYTTSHEPGIVESISVYVSHDPELDTDDVVFSLSLSTPSSEEWERWESVLKFLDSRLSSDDKIRTLVRIAP